MWDHTKHKNNVLDLVHVYYYIIFIIYNYNFNYVVYLSKPKEPVSKVVAAAELADIETGKAIYNGNQIAKIKSFLGVK